MNNDRYESKDIYQAAKILNLKEIATMKDIKRNYRQLIKRWHPDKCQSDPVKCREKTEEITQAYKAVLYYCKNYRYSFKEGEIIEHLPVEGRLKERLKEQFRDFSF